MDNKTGAQKNKQESALDNRFKILMDLMNSPCEEEEISKTNQAYVGKSPLVIAQDHPEVAQGIILLRFNNVETTDTAFKNMWSSRLKERGALSMLKSLQLPPIIIDSQGEDSSGNVKFTIKESLPFIAEKTGLPNY